MKKAGLILSLGAAVTLADVRRTVAMPTEATAIMTITAPIPLMAVMMPADIIARIIAGANGDWARTTASIAGRTAVIIAAVTMALRVLIVGGVAGGVLGNVIAPGGSQTLGTILGALGGAAAAGRSIAATARTMCAANSALFA